MTSEAGQGAGQGAVFPLVVSSLEGLRQTETEKGFKKRKEMERKDSPNCSMRFNSPISHI